MRGAVFVGILIVSCGAASGAEVGEVNGATPPSGYRIPMSEEALNSCMKKPKTDAKNDEGPPVVTKFVRTTAADCVSANTKIMDQSLDSLKAMVKRRLAVCAEPTDRLRKPIQVKIGERVMTKELCIQANQKVLDLMERPNVTNASQLLMAMATEFEWYRFKGDNEDSLPKEKVEKARKNVRFTGYNSPTINCSKTFDLQKGFIYPIYKKPPNKEDASLTREEIETGHKLEGKGLAIAFTRDPLDIFLMHIEGSGTCILPNGKPMALPHAGTNGRAYRSLGKILECVENADGKYMSYPGFREYFRLFPHKREALLNLNPSYVFLSDGGEKGDSAVGFGRAVLAPAHSAAVDLSLIPMGTFMFVSAERPVEEPLSPKTIPFANIMTADDRGGAILDGHVDVFWGSDKYSEIAAGKMSSMGHMCVMIPKPPEAEAP